VDELTLNPEGRGEALYEGVVTPEDPIVYEKGYPACAVAVVALVIATPEEGGVASAYTSSIVKSAFWVLDTMNENFPMAVVTAGLWMLAGNVPGARMATLLAKTAKVPEASEVDAPLSGRL